MKNLLVSCILPCLVASNSLPILYSPTCLSITSMSSTSLALLPGSQIQHYSSSKVGNIELYKNAPIITPTFTQSSSLTNASSTDALPAKAPQICRKEQISSYPELQRISSAFVLAIELGDVNYIKEGALVATNTQNEILGRYLELENKHLNEREDWYSSGLAAKGNGVWKRIEKVYMNIWVAMCVVGIVVVLIIMERGGDLFGDSNTEKTFMIELVENIEEVNRNTEEIQNDIELESIERCNEDIDRILLKVDTLLHTSASFQQAILSANSSLTQTVKCISASLKRSYSLPALNESQSTNPPNNQESPQDNIELEPIQTALKEETASEIEFRILTEKENTSDLDESFSSYEDLAEYSEEVEDSILNFNSRVSREYDMARSLWGRSKKPGFMVENV